MAFGLTKTVQARTEAQVDQALATADRVVVEGDDQLLAYAAAQAAKSPPPQTSPGASTEALGRSGSKTTATQMGGVIGVPVIGAGGWVLGGKLKTGAPPGSGDRRQGATAASSQPPAWQIVPSWSGLVWPGVVILAMVLWFLLVRQAIRAGADVRVEWKVTNRFSGRLVLSKVRAPAPRQPGASHGHLSNPR